MPTLLDVHACPRKARSRTRKIREAFLEGYKSKHPGAGIVELDLAECHDDLPVFDEWDVEAKFEMLYGEGKLDDQMASRWNALTTYTDQLHTADVVLVSTPMWNFSIPWMLKRWFDTVIQPRLTFEVRDGQYHGLLKGRRGVVVATRDGAYAPGTPYAALDFHVPYVKQVLGFMGLDPVEVILAEPLGMAGPEVGRQVLEKAVGEARALGAKV